MLVHCRQEHMPLLPPTSCDRSSAALEPRAGSTPSWAVTSCAALALLFGVLSGCTTIGYDSVQDAPPDARVGSWRPVHEGVTSRDGQADCDPREDCLWLFGLEAGLQVCIADGAVGLVDRAGVGARNFCT